jgi:hypothetical protein
MGRQNVAHDIFGDKKIATSLHLHWLQPRLSKGRKRLGWPLNSQHTTVPPSAGPHPTPCFGVPQLYVHYIGTGHPNEPLDGRLTQFHNNSKELSTLHGQKEFLSALPR